MNKFSLILIFIFGFCCSDTYAQWNKLQPVAGAPYILGFTSLGSVIFAGGQGGIFRSTNNGASWVACNGTLDTISTAEAQGGINATLIGTSRQSIFASYGTFFRNGSVGTYKSTDNGNNWEPLDSTFRSGQLLDNGTYLFSSSGSGIYRSSDDGLTWGEVSTGLKSLNVIFLDSNGSQLRAFTDSGLFVSTNDGKIWTAASQWTLNSRYVTQLASSGTYIYAAKDSGYYDTQQGFFMTSNSGASWTEIDSNPPNYFTIVGSDVEAAYGYIPEYLHRSTNRGLTWTDHAIPASPYFSGIYSVGGASFIYDPFFSISRSLDTGLTWVSGDSGMTESPAGVFVVSANSSDIYVGTSSDDLTGHITNGVSHSTDHGLTWSPTNTGLKWYHDVYSISQIDTDAFAATDSGLYHSSNDGVSWNRIVLGPHLGSLYESINFTSEGICISGNNLFITTDSGIFRSSDRGSTWNSCGNPGLLVGAFGDTLFSIANGLFRSTNLGSTWAKVYSSNMAPLAEVGPNFIGVSTNNASYISTDGGTIWLELQSGLPDDVAAFINSGTKIFAVSRAVGIYGSKDSGFTWLSANSGINSEFVSGATNGNPNYAPYTGISTDGTNLYAVNGNIWSRPLSQFPLIVNESDVFQPSKTNLFSVYPNPFSKSTQITLTSQAAGYAEVSIVNMLGVEVARLFSGELGEGEHKFSWSDPTGLPDGAYECLVRMNGQVETLPMVLMH